MAARLALQFVSSATKAATLPDSPGEIAMVGRSNVGKSSLINALAGNKTLARVSNTPGRTQLINLYTLPGGATVVDLPGYGFAAVPTREKAKWQPMIEGYLLNREPLRALLLLLDGEIGPTKLDVNMLEWLRDCDLPFAVIATKHDKVKSSVRQKRKRELAAGCGLEERDITWVSASKGVNLDQLRDRIHRWLSPEEPVDDD